MAEISPKEVHDWFRSGLSLAAIFGAFLLNYGYFKAELGYHSREITELKTKVKELETGLHDLQMDFATSSLIIKQLDPKMDRILERLQENARR